MASTLLCYTLSLLSKPMLVTLPALLLLLDFWPLGRTARRPLRELVIEKLPLAAVALGVAWLALLTQAAGGAMDPSATLSFDRRIAHALVSPVLYLGKLLWPVDLSVVYPHPELFGTAWSAVQVVLASLLLIALSAAAVAFRRRGQLLMGWFWFLISLAPVVGLVQVGVQGMADRFMYVPAMGLYVAVAFTGFDLARAERPALRMALAALAAAALVACAVASARQATYWRDSESLYLQALRATPDNPLVGAYYGHWLESEGRSTEALEHYRRMTRYDASASAGYLNSARLLMRRGLADEAIEQLRTATGLVPEEPEAWIQLASVFLTHPNPERRDPAAALAAAGRAVALPRGQSAAALEVLSAAQSAAGLGADAIRSARRALVLAETEGQHQRARVLRQRLHALGVAVSPGD